LKAILPSDFGTGFYRELKAENHPVTFSVLARHMISRLLIDEGVLHYESTITNRQAGTAIQNINGRSFSEDGGSNIRD